MVIGRMHSVSALTNQAGILSTAPAAAATWRHFWLSTSPGPSLQHAVSANLPLSWDVVRHPHWPAFLFDVVPSGAARRFLLPRLPLASGPATRPAFELLSRGTRAPIGQLRIRKAAAIGEEVATIAFRRDQVIDLSPDFLDHAYAQGAPWEAPPAPEAMRQSCC